MQWATIEKPKRGWKIIPNLLDYERTMAIFSWERARRELNGLPNAPGLNIAHEAIDRHAAGHRRSHLALRWLGRHGEVRDFTYGDLRVLTYQFANVLKNLGVNKGERVFVLAGRVPELYISALGTLKNGSVFCPLFSAFGPEPIRQRLTIGDGKVLVTTATLYKRKVAEIRSSLPNLEHVLLVGSAEETTPIQGTLNFQQQMVAVSSEFTIAPTNPEDLALLHFTKGLRSNHELFGRFSLSYDSRNSLRIPTRGSHLVLFVGGADRALLSSVSYSSFGVEARHYVPLH